jgi:hypothetical protein
MTNNATIQYDILKARVASWIVHTKENLGKQNFTSSHEFPIQFVTTKTPQVVVLKNIALNFGSSRKEHN